MNAPDWMKFKAINRNLGCVKFGMFDNLLHNQPDKTVSTVVKTDTLRVVIDQSTICRFVTHIPGVGDLYEADKGWFKSEINFLTRAMGEVFWDNASYCWAVRFELRGKVYKVALYECEFLEFTGNIHDPE